MADYTLQDGVGTSVRESTSPDQGYVDVDLYDLSAMTDPADTDVLAVQRNTSNPQKMTLLTLKSMVDGATLSLGYIY